MDEPLPVEGDTTTQPPEPGEPDAAPYQIKGFDPRQALVVLLKLYSADGPVQISDDALAGQDTDQLQIVRTPGDDGWLIELLTVQ